MRSSLRNTQTGLGAVTPARVLSVVGVLLVLFVLLAPQPRADESAAFSSYATGAGGSRALHDVFERLHFDVSRNDGPLNTAPSSGSVYVLLRPAQPLTTSEQNRLVGAVARGAILVFTPEDESLADSLGFGLIVPTDFYTLQNATVAGGNPPETATDEPARAFRAAVPINATVGSRSRSGNDPFLWLTPRGPAKASGDSTKFPALVRGHRFGRGYVIAIAPSQIVMNQALRFPATTIAIVRAIRFACASVSTGSPCGTVVFDEYHHGFGKHADMIGTIRRSLTNTPPGRTTVELVAASLVLLLAFAVRPLAPVAATLVSRRSPLEHVGALAYAYSRVNARALGSRRLVRGLRRRHPLGIPLSLPDQTYLTALRSRLPFIAADIDSIIAAVSADSSTTSDNFAAAGNAFANIERSMVQRKVNSRVD